MGECVCKDFNISFTEVSCIPIFKIELTRYFKKINTFNFRKVTYVKLTPDTNGDSKLNYLRIIRGDSK